GIYTYGGVIYEKKFGDLILWKQIIAHSKTLGNSSIVFLTDDEKQDWWWTVESQGRKRLGPRPELVDELIREGGSRGFYIYNSVQFLSYAKVHLQAEISQESIE